MEKIAIIGGAEKLRKATAARLMAAGYEVFTAPGAQEGLGLIRAQRPRVVLLDLVTTKKQGFAVCQEIRRDPGLRAIKVILTSRQVNFIDEQKAGRLGANSCLAKPLDLEDTVEKVQQALELAGPPITVKFWGVRGSIPTPGPATIRYGGNTMCVEVRCGDKILMLDCGTGAREMGLALSREFLGRAAEVHIFVSHTHWDHIHGFPFFAPAYTPGSRVMIYSHGGYDKSLKKVFSGQMDVRYFPVPLSDLVARLEFVVLKGPVQVGPARVSHFHLNHPGIAIGFRIDVGPKSVVYITDHEPYRRMHGDNARNRKLDSALDKFVRGADLYIREAQYTEEEYPSRRGWGHSVWKDALNSAQEANVKTLAIVHHEPSHDDATMDQILAACRQYMKEHGMQFTCFAATENQEILL